MVLQLLAQSEPDNTAAQWYLWVSIIMLIGALVVLIPVVAGVGRRWKRRQLKAIEEDRDARRAGKTGERLDAWSASAERYVDHDKLPAEDELFEHSGDDHEEDVDHDDPPGDMDEGGSPEDDERDPFGLFEDKPYRDADDEDDEDDFDGDDDDDWDADEDEDDDKR